MTTTSGKPVSELKWYFEAMDPQNPVKPHHAIIDEEGFVVVGMAHMRESTAREIVRNHNDGLNND